MFRRTVRPAAPGPEPQPLDPFAIPGRGGADKGPAPECDACGSESANRTLSVVGPDLVVVLCVDAAECAKRYRGGVSAESYAAELRGDILTAASL